MIETVYRVRINFGLRDEVGWIEFDKTLPQITNELDEFGYYYGSPACIPYIEFETDTKASAEIAQQEIIEAIRPLVEFEGEVK